MSGAALSGSTRLTARIDTGVAPFDESGGANRLMAERAALENKISQLETSARAYRDERYRLQRREGEAMSQACAVGQRVRLCEAALERGVDTSGDRFVWTVVDAPSGRVDEFRSPGEAGEQIRLALLALIEQQRPEAGAVPDVRSAAVGALCSFRVEADVTSWPDGRNNVALKMGGLPVDPVAVEGHHLADGDLADVVAALENRVNSLPQTAAGYRAEELVFRRQEARIGARLDQPFEHQGRLDALRIRLRDIDDRLTPPEIRVDTEPATWASIRRLPRPPRPDDPANVTEYDDCPLCLSSDLRSLPEGGDDQVRCKECGWIGSYPPRLRLVDAGIPQLTPAEADVGPASTSLWPGAAHRARAHLEPASSTSHSETTTGNATADGVTETTGAAPAIEGPAPALPSIHQQHQLHQQLYPGPQDLAPIQP